MAEALKKRGIIELMAFRRRARRQRAMGRIEKADFDFIEEHVDAIHSRIVSMSETDKDGKEVDL